MSHYTTTPLPLYDEVLFGCKCPRAAVRERKPHVDNSVAFLLTQRHYLLSFSMFIISCYNADFCQSQMAPGGKFPSPTKPKPPAKSPSAVESPSQSQSPPVGGTRHNLPAKPTGSALTAVTALDRVQASLSELSVEPRQRRGPPHAGSHLHWQSAPRAVDVPDTEFDFSKGTEKFEKERENRRGNGTEGGEGQGEDGQGVEEVGEPEMAPHPSVVANGKPNGANGASGRNGSGSGNGNGVGGISEHTGGANGLDGVKGSSAYNKGSFFDALTGESSRISRNEERHRNLDTFGEAGGSAGGMGYGMRGRGGYRGGGYGRGGGAAGGYGGGGGGTKNDGYGGQGYRGRGRGGGGGGGYGNRQGYQQPQ